MFTFILKNLFSRWYYRGISARAFRTLRIVDFIVNILALVLIAVGSAFLLFK